MPSPSYPIHIFAPLFAGASAREIPMSTDGNFIERVREAYEYSWPKPRVIVLSFPHNPTTATVELDFFQQVVDFAREQEVIVVHDNAYAELGFDGFEPPSILQAEGAKECAVELYSMTKSFSMAGLAGGVPRRQRRGGAGAGQAQVVPRLRHLPAHPDRRHRHDERGRGHPSEVQAVYQGRRDVLIDGLHRIGWDVPRPRGTMFAWAPIPEPYREMGSVEFASMLVREAQVALSPGVGFGPGGEGYVRFALIENEQRTQQALRNLRRTLTKLG